MKNEDSVVVEDLGLQNNVELLSVQELVGDDGEAVVGGGPRFLHEGHGRYGLCAIHSKTARKDLRHPRGDFRSHQIPTAHSARRCSLLVGVLALVLGNGVPVQIEGEVAVRVIVPRGEISRRAVLRLVLLPLHTFAASGGLQIGLHDHVEVADVGVFDAVRERASEFQKHDWQNETKINKKKSRRLQKMVVSHENHRKASLDRLLQSTHLHLSVQYRPLW